MYAIVVYESHWGNTAEIARAIAEGIGDGATAMSTSEAVPAVVARADLVVAGAPVNAFGLPTSNTRAMLAAQEATPRPDLSHQSLRDWLEHLPRAAGACAAFDTRLRWTPGGAISGIQRRLEAAGYREVATPLKAVVTGAHGPLRAGEAARARAWGAELRRAMEVGRQVAS
ncbi:MAG TPA: hypothetical protein VF484_11410 [Candidatus Limnocylindrales bacterium]